MGGKTRTSNRRRSSDSQPDAPLLHKPAKRKSKAEVHRDGTAPAPGEDARLVLDAVDRLYTDAQGTASILAAVESLYADGLKPYGRILRKRLGERACTKGVSAKALPSEFENLRQRCEASTWLEVSEEEGGDWSAVLVGHPQHFVDVYCTWDPYSPDLWASVTAYFMCLEDPEAILPGGRYACASALVGRNLPFLQGFSLGQVCHIVQLAISQRKLLGYLSGSIVPYARSQSMVKDCCAWRQAPCEASGEAHGKSEENISQQDFSTPSDQRSVATWETARACLKEIIDDAVNKGVGSVPLSNIKRFFRSRCQLELSETALGHPKLSELLQDARMQDICEVRLRGQGYTVFPPSPGAAAAPMPQLQLLDCTWSDAPEQRQQTLNLANTNTASSWMFDSSFPAWTTFPGGVAYCDGLQTDITGYFTESYLPTAQWAFEAAGQHENTTVLPTGQWAFDAAGQPKSETIEVAASSSSLRSSYAAEESGSEIEDITTACLTDEPSSRESMLDDEDACSEDISSAASPYICRATARPEEPEPFALSLPETGHVWRIRNTFIDCLSESDVVPKRSHSAPRSVGVGLSGRRNMKLVPLNALRLPENLSGNEASYQQDELPSPTLTASPRFEEPSYWGMSTRNDAPQRAIRLSDLL